MTTDNFDLHQAASITDGLKTVSYVKNGEGRLEQVQSDSWQPVNEVNFQAWQEIEKQIHRAKCKVASGRASRLYYYMIANQMNMMLLARYTRQSAIRVFFHLNPFFFKRLSNERLKRYADLFKISVEHLTKGELQPPIYHSSGTHE